MFYIDKKQEHYNNKIKVIYLKEKIFGFLQSIVHY